MESNTALSAAIKRLEFAVRESIKEQRQTRSHVDKIVTEFNVWRETKCADHERRIADTAKAEQRDDKRIGEVSRDLDVAVARVAVVYGVLLLGVQVAVSFLK